MSDKKGSSNKYEDMEVRRGPWTLEEDTLLVHYIASHGEGRWNLLARCSGLKRTGKSCRLRWLNYLKPDIKRGNLSPEEHLLIHELHSRWGNRWSRIAQYLPGRTDNEIKNYWRTRMQKQARQLKIDPSSTTFRDAIRYHCRMPRLPEKMSSPHSMQTLHANAAPQDPLQGLLQPSTHCQFENPSPYELSGAGIGSNSTGLSSTVLLPQVPDLKVSSSSPTAEINGVEFNPFHSGSSVDTTYGVGACDDLAAMTASANCYPASSSSTTTASNHFMNSINGDSMWGMDELYGMLKSYIDGAESTCFLGTKLKVDAQLN